VLRVVSQLTYPVMFGSGRPHLALRFSAATLIMLSAGMLFVGFTFPAANGVVGMSTVWLVVPPLLLLWQAHYLRRYWNIGARDLIRAAAAPCVAVVFLVLAAEAGRHLIGTGNPALSTGNGPDALGAGLHEPAAARSPRAPGDGRSRLSRDAERVRQNMIEALCDPPLSTQAAESQQEFSPTQARILVKDLFKHSARIYWADFLLTLFLRVWRRCAVSGQSDFLAEMLHRLHGRRIRPLPLRRVHSRNRTHSPGAHALIRSRLEYPVRHPRPDALFHVQVPLGPSQSAPFRHPEGRGISLPGSRSGEAHRLVLPAGPVVAGIGDI